jgi:hypothetical protein
MNIPLHQSAQCNNGIENSQHCSPRKNIICIMLVFCKTTVMMIHEGAGHPVIGVRQYQDRHDLRFILHGLFPGFSPGEYKSVTAFRAEFPQTHILCTVTGDLFDVIDEYRHVSGRKE